MHHETQGISELEEMLSYGCQPITCEDIDKSASEKQRQE